jgi:hypothetical protein
MKTSFVSKLTSVDDGTKIWKNAEEAMGFRMKKNDIA